MLISFVVPCFNEEKPLGELLRRLEATADLLDQPCEFVLVDDGSTDRTWEIITRESARLAQLRGVRLSTNWGHQAAVSAGLDAACGDRVLILDADLQDPPELAVEMMALMDQGYDMVYGRRRDRKSESLFKKATARAYYRLMSYFSDGKIPEDVGDFRMVNRQVLDSVRALPERTRYLRGLFAYVGFRQIGIEYDRDARNSGETKYPLAKMLRLGFDGITSFSDKPLRLAISFSLLSILLCLAICLYVLISWLLFNTAPGWASILITVSAFASVQLFCVGIIGEYLARIYTEVKNRPLYLVAEDTSESDGRTDAG
ncbi:glycosyltransferase family 2 protein [Primorskyibacter aestuariivivens]|uniref:glycosyltransferase family 2 protein n=1 Tax=Primorskyibacter aestuariivivens TaxID=1888912 RepID=UPI0022FFEA71|nr:glycosyltransferase family 2 protein [Primorskyibacter aestuariivivens]MDA7427605.1 glycosyltransferase family 2 protein [Primorskyibacter aestuariivivens]